MTDWDSGSNILKDIQAAKHAIEQETGPKPTPPKSIRRAERSQPNMNIRPAVFNWNEYIVACVICKSTTNLCMLGQRSKEGIVAPWVFICENCFELVENKKICIDFKNPGHSKEAE